MITKVSVRVRYGPRSGVMALLAVAVLVTAFLGYLVLRPKGAAADAQVLKMQTVQSSYAPLRQYYLTSSYAYNGSQATSACAAGYHMASLWEILDPSNLRYNTALGDSRADSGMGPPTISFGWVRTGHNNDSGTAPGQANCNTWSSASGAHNGTTVRLATDWSDATQQDMFVWDAGVRACSDTAPVWCVADLVGSGVCADPLYISDGQQVDGDTSLYSNNINSYTCSSWDETGPETLYVFTLPAGGFYTVTATISGMTADLDVFLLSSAGCGDPGQCLAVDSYGDTTAVAAPVSPGTYYIAVDGYYGASDVYSVELTIESGARGKVYIPLTMRDYP